WLFTCRLTGSSAVCASPPVAAHFTDGGIWMAGPETDHAPKPAARAPGGADEPVAQALGDLPVQLVFELARTEIALSDLRTVAPGYVFELGRDRSQPVDILANGRRIGRGEVVQIEDELGVRVVRLFDDD
ncbi:MAG TPA: FliM/FliN family flagellar motor switch protein, partial [Alphaproteobacteria bacterium]|nr:FliM/FliN family flagellar motor switch protein [Alphaproteobacteria bacterium]